MTTRPNSTLTQEQKSFLDTFGFLMLRGYVADRIDRIIAEFEAIFASQGGGHHGQPHDGQKRSCIIRFADHSPFLCSLLDDPLIDALASHICGDDYNYSGSDGNYYVGDTGWHCDCRNPDYYRLKIAFYLDPLTRDTGALRVVPGSHKLTDPHAEILQRDVPRSKDVWGIPGSEVPAVALETVPGDVVCFNQSTLHSAWGGSPRRRMFTINFAPHVSEDRLDLLRSEIAANARFWVDRFYHPTLIETASPERMRHLEQIHQNDGFLAELSAAKRKEMAEPSRG